MRRFHAGLTITLLVMILVSACAPSGGGTAEPGFADFDPGNFDNSTVIDNVWMPLKPGTRWVHEGTAVEDGETIARRIEFTVTDLTKVIQGVRTVVAWIVDYDDGEVIEKEIAFYAQDNDGNVWYLGEHPEEYDTGRFVTAPTWIAGVADAKPGVKMWKEPKVGGPIVYQGWGPAVEWSDYGQVDQMGQETCVPVDCYKDVLVIAESSLGEVDAYQLKYFAQGVGEVQVGWRGKDATQEELKLVELTMLTSEQLAEVRAEALEVEKHAYAISNVYRETPPVEYPVGTAAIDISAIPLPPTPSAATTGSAAEVIVYASDLSPDALSELDFYDDPESPGGKFISLPNNGDELDAPPENDPHVTFTVEVQSGIPYRCWIHMKVGAPKGRSDANIMFAQFSDSVDEADQELFKPGSDSYLTAEGPTKEGWTWVECDRADSEAEPLVYFATDGEVTVRLQAGAEGVGFDQFLLSSAEFLNDAPSEPIVEK